MKGNVSFLTFDQMVCFCIFLNSTEREFHLNRNLGDILYKTGQSASATLLRTKTFLLTLLG